MKSIDDLTKLYSDYKFQEKILVDTLEKSQTGIDTGSSQEELSTAIRRQVLQFDPRNTFDRNYKLEKINSYNN